MFLYYFLRKVIMNLCLVSKFIFESLPFILYYTSSLIMDNCICSCVFLAHTWKREKNWLNENVRQHLNYIVLEVKKCNYGSSVTKLLFEMNRHKKVLLSTMRKTLGLFLSVWFLDRFLLESLVNGDWNIRLKNPFSHFYLIK